jgi:phosphoribosylaminoimidazole-succinocarboxamide synthase
VFCKGAIYKLKVPPGSLTGFGVFAQELTNRGITIGNVKVLLGFDEKQTFPIITFAFGGFVKETALPKLAEMASSSEVTNIINEVMAASTPTTPAIENKAELKPQPAVKKVVKEEPADDGLGLDEPVKVEVVKEEPVVVADAVSTPDNSALADELGL